MITLTFKLSDIFEMSQQIKFFRETTLPDTFVPYSIYFITDSDSAEHTNIYVSSADGTSARRVMTPTDVNTAITGALGNINEITVVNDIGERDTIRDTKPNASYVYVLDATIDSTVTAGGATYLFNASADSWVKVSETESMDVVLKWANIQDKPTSTVADIDEAVTQRHTHANKAVLDKLSEDANGEMLYNDTPVSIRWNSVNW